MTTATDDQRDGLGLAPMETPPNSKPFREDIARLRAALAEAERVLREIRQRALEAEDARDFLLWASEAARAHLAQREAAPDPLGVECPRCGARPNERCHEAARVGWAYTDDPHTERAAKAREVKP